MSVRTEWPVRLASAAPSPASLSYCNCLALERQLDPAGSAGDFDDAVLMELPLPWPGDLYTNAAALPPEVRDLVALWVARYEETGEYRHRQLVIAPDPAYSQAGRRRVLFYTRPAGLMTRFEKLEYQVPEAELGAFVWSLYEDRAALPRFERYRAPQADGLRDLLVCTHGSVDVACAKFGYPLYKALRARYADAATRVWRVSHFGGHVFAPTMMDMPTGRYWAYVDAKQAEQIAARTGEVAALRGHYRGWAGAPYGFAQAAECEVWQREGWAWFDVPKRCKVIAQEEAEDPSWAEVRLEFNDSEGRAGAYHARVEVSHTVETPPQSGSAETYGYPQYQVVSLTRSEA